MAKLNKALNRNQFMAELAQTSHMIGGVPFIFDLESESGKLFLERLELAGLKASKGEVSGAVSDFFNEREKWSMKVSGFSNLGGGKFEVGLSPDDLATRLSILTSARRPFFP